MCDHSAERLHDHSLFLAWIIKRKNWYVVMSSNISLHFSCVTVCWCINNFFFFFRRNGLRVTGIDSLWSKCCFRKLYSSAKNKTSANPWSPSALKSGQIGGNRSAVDGLQTSTWVQSLFAQRKRPSECRDLTLNLGASWATADVAVVFTRRPFPTAGS